MARKVTQSKSAAKQAEARKRMAARSSASSPTPAKTAARKPTAPAAAKKNVAKPAGAVKPEAARKPQPKKPIAAPAKPASAAKLQPAPAAHAAKSAAAHPAPAGKGVVLPKGVHAGAVTAPRAAAAPARPMPAAMSKQPGQAITAPATPKAMVPKAAAVPPQPAAAKKPVHQRHGFKTNEWIVYPAHGVGRIVGIEEQEIAGMSLELFVITFEKDKMTLRVPTGKSQSVGMRKLADENVVKRAMETLKGRARIKRTMWSRRAQEYEAKINSGDLIAIAEVVRDLYRSESQPEQSYSERQLYEAALDRMAREIAAVEKLDERGAVQRITEVLAKSAKGRRMAAEEAEVKAA